MTDLTRLREEYDTLSYMDEDGAWGASDALIAALEQRVKELETAHAVEVTGLLRSFMGYLTALTASGSDMVTFVAQKLEPYHAFEDKEPTP